MSAHMPLYPGPRGWRGQAPRQPGQIRKEAAATSPAWVDVNLSPKPRAVLFGYAHAGPGVVLNKTGKQVIYRNFALFRSILPNSFDMRRLTPLAVSPFRCDAPRNCPKDPTQHTSKRDRFMPGHSRRMAIGPRAALA